MNQPFSLYRLNKGITLIELLVVIAIVGVLSAVILSSLNSARTKGGDANIKANLITIRSQSAIYYDAQNPESYGSFSLASCPNATSTASGMFVDLRIINALNSAVAQGSGVSRCVAANGSYAVAMGLKNGTQSWCVDAQGSSKLYNGLPSAAITISSCN